MIYTPLDEIVDLKMPAATISSVDACNCPGVLAPANSFPIALVHVAFVICTAGLPNIVCLHDYSRYLNLELNRTVPVPARRGKQHSH